MSKPMITLLSVVVLAVIGFTLGFFFGPRIEKLYKEHKEKKAKKPVVVADPVVA